MVEANPSGATFRTTHWSKVLAAGSSGTEGSAALETLCRACWPPIYAYIRRVGHSPEESCDLTQEFFADLLAHQSLAAAQPALGRFRSYLLGALKHFLADVHDRNTTQKRGGGREVVSLDSLTGEESYGWEPADQLSPDRLFERRWALTMMARALGRLEEECQLSGKSHLFATLRGFLSEGAASITYPEAAAELGFTEANVRMTVTRLRRRYGELVRTEISETLGTHADLEDELRHLVAILRGE